MGIGFVGCLIGVGIAVVVLGGRDWSSADGRLTGDTTTADLRTRGTRAAGPLRVSPLNPRYLTDDSSRPVYLTGAHTWSNFQDIGGSDPPAEFDFDRYLDLLSQHNHNFIRLWVWEQARWAPSTVTDVYFRPLLYERTGPGIARDGAPKFDLRRFNQHFFDRLRSRVAAAGARGIYVSVMLFQGWSIEKKAGRPGNPWPGHPYHADNNINGISGDLDGDDQGQETHTLGSPQTLRLQEAYVRKVVDTLNDLDNVVWEISNESHRESSDWQYHMIDVIRRYEATKPKQHPIGMTANRWDTNANLLASPATWISPSTVDGYKHNPPPAAGNKVIISDTDHLWGLGGDRMWVWKSFMRGLNPIYMDDLGPDSTTAAKEDARRAMGDTLAYANRLKSTSFIPRGDLASSTYCLADPGVEYLIYVPIEPHRAASRIAHMRFVSRFQALLTKSNRWVRGLFRQAVTVDLSAARGELALEWFNPATHQVVARETIRGGAKKTFKAPFLGDAVLYITARDCRGAGRTFVPMCTSDSPG